VRHELWTVELDDLAAAFDRAAIDGLTVVHVERRVDGDYIVIVRRP
jgi:hypothetical protein